MRKRSNWNIRAEYRDAVICGAIERNATIPEAMAEARRVMPWLSYDVIKIQTYDKRRRMVREGRVGPGHGITRSEQVRL